MRPPFSYMGAKTRMVPHIVPLLGQHTCYTEAFGGSFAVLLAKDPAQVEVANDLDAGLVTFWRMLRDQPDALVRACTLTPHSHSEYALDPWDAADDLERARRVWVRMTQGFKPTMQWAGWRSHHAEALARKLPRASEHLLALAQRIQHVSLDCRPAEKVIRHWDSPTTTHYVDPPYVAETKTSAGTDEYLNEMSNDDHRSLAATLQACEGRVVLSGYPGDLYDELYADWTTYDVKLNGHLSRDGRVGAFAIERLWINQPATEITLF